MVKTGRESLDGMGSSASYRGGGFRDVALQSVRCQASGAELVCRYILLPRPLWLAAAHSVESLAGSVRLCESTERLRSS